MRCIESEPAPSPIRRLEPAASSAVTEKTKEVAFVRQRIMLVVVTGLAVLLPSGVAAANSKQFTTVEAPAELLNGAPGPALDELEDLGADAIRIQLGWGSVAPDPDARTKPSFNATDP